MANPETPQSIADLLERASKLLQSTSFAEGLPPAQWQTLRFLARANRFSRTPGAIGLYLGVTKGTVSQTVIALVKKGYVRKEHNQPDRRSVTLRLTRRGETALARDPIQDVVSALSELPADRRAALGAALADLIDAMLKTKGGRPFGQCATCRFFRPNGSKTDKTTPHRCGLLDVPLSAEDSSLICVEHARAA